MKRTMRKKEKKIDAINSYRITSGHAPGHVQLEGQTRGRRIRMMLELQAWQRASYVTRVWPLNERMWFNLNWSQLFSPESYHLISARSLPVNPEVDIEEKKQSNFLTPLEFIAMRPINSDPWCHFPLLKRLGALRISTDFAPPAKPSSITKSSC